jgi:E3 ubiquitin-protein ligase FANCL
MMQLEKLERIYGGDAIKELSNDLLRVTLQYRDGAGRNHEMNLELSPDTFPHSCPKCTSELPTAKGGWQPSWKQRNEPRPSQRQKVELDDQVIHVKDTGECQDDGIGYGLVSLYADFASAVQIYQDVWNELDDLDAGTWVLEPSIRPPRRSVLERRVALSEVISIVLDVDYEHPRALPKSLRWIGADTLAYRKKLEQYIADSGWSMQLSIKDNLERSLGICLPSPPSEACDIELVECSICYTHDLPTENGSSEFPDAVCDNLPCGRHYHGSCLHDWLHSLPSSRKSFDRLVGTCPYCSEPISAALQQK